MQKKSNYHFTYPINIRELDLATMVSMYRQTKGKVLLPPKMIQHGPTGFILTRYGITKVEILVRKFYLRVASKAVEVIA